MPFKGLMLHAKIKKLFKHVSLAEIAEQQRRKTGDEPVIAVDGPGCVWYLYQNCDFRCGGQYKEFREICRNFVREFRDCGVRLVFFFQGIRAAEKNKRWVQTSKDNTEKLKQIWQKILEEHGEEKEPLPLPEGLIACARVFFRDEPSAEVRLSLEDYKKEASQYAASCGNCLGVMSNDGNFLVYKDVPRVFTFQEKVEARITLRMKYLCQSDITSDLGLKAKDLPAFMVFYENWTISVLDLLLMHERLGTIYCEDTQKLAHTVANLVRNKTVKKMCRTAFGNWWREFVDIVKAGIGHYEYKPRRTGNGAEMGSHWSRVLQSIEPKHTSGDVPGVLLSVARHRLGAIVEDFPQAQYGCTSTGDALQRMRHRMYTVLLWESGDGPFYLEELVGTRTNRIPQQVEVQKWLLPSLVHPGLLKLWTGDLDTRWRLFSWIVGSPDPDGSALRSLEPQFLVVPAAALSFLRHKTRLLSPQEAEVFAVVAISVFKFSPQELAQKHLPDLDPRAIFLSTLFVHAALQVLDSAAVCGLSFPREADCQLDAYFDGKLFHDLYLKAKGHTPWKPLYLDPIHRLLDVIEGTCTG